MRDANFALRHELSRHSLNLRFWKSLQFSLWCAFGAQLAVLALIPIRDALGIASPGHLLLYASATALLCGGIAGMLVSQSAHATARFLDAKFYLEERLQTALELAGRPKSTQADFLARDALGALRKKRPTLARRDEVRALQWTPLLVTSLAALLLLSLPPFPANMMPATRLAVPPPGTPPASPTTPEQAEPKVASGQNEPLSPAETQTIAAHVAYKESAIDADPHDFASFVSSGDDRLEFLDAHGEGTPSADRAQKPIRIEPQGPSQPSSGFESGGPSQDEVAERMTEFEEAMTRSSAAAQQKGAAQPEATKRPMPDESDAPETQASGSEAPVQTPPVASASVTTPEESEKGSSKEATAPASDTPGTPSSDDVQMPSQGTAKPTFDQDPQTARFGGGQYPHNAPGAGFPDWMRGDADPHFMDAGQGEGASTGKTSGQAGVGHAMLNKGPEVPALDLPSIKDLHISGQLQDGDRSTYETEMLGRTTDGGTTKLQDTDILAQYQFRAEEQMSRNQVPLIFREHVQNYFSRIQ